MTTKDDPYHDIKPYHMAHLFAQGGGVSPLCAKKPRRLNLERALWTLRWEAVTCRRCLALKPPEDPTPIQPQPRAASGRE